MAGSDYYIRVALDQGSIAKARAQILQLSRLSVPNIDVRGQLIGQQGVITASRAALELTNRRLVAEREVGRVTASAAQVSATWQQRQANGMAALRSAQDDVLRRKRAETQVNQQLIAQEQQKASASRATVQQAQRAQSAAGTAPVVSAASTPVAQVQRVVNETRAIAGSSNVAVRGLAALSTEFQAVGGSTTSAADALVRGQLSMRGMAAATIETAARLTFWAAGAAAIYSVVEVLQQVKDAALDADEAMINLSRVVPNADREQGGRDMIRLMREMALGAGDVGEAMFQMGKLFDSQSDAVAGAETVLLATKIAELDVVDASQQLVKVQRAYGLESSHLITILDKLNDQQNKLGVDISKSLMGVSRAAGVTKSVGGDLDSLIARITVLQRLSGFAPETVSRVNQRLAVQLATLKGQQRIAQTLADQGTNIKIVDSEGELKDIDVLLSEIGARFTTFNATQQSEISLALTGGNQGGLSALTTTLLQNYDEVEKQTKSVANSQGSARQELETTMKSMRNQLALVGVEIQAIGVNLANSGMLESIALMTTGLRETLEVVNELLATFNLLPKEIRVTLVGIASLRAAAAVLRGLRGGAIPGAVAGAAALAGRNAHPTSPAQTGAATAATNASNRYTASLQRETVARRNAVTAANAALAAETVASRQRSTIAIQTNARMLASYRTLGIAQSRLTASAYTNGVAITRASEQATTATRFLGVAMNTQAEAATRATRAAQAHSAALAREALATGTASAASSGGLIGRMRGMSGGSVIGGALLASIVGDVIQEYGKERGNDRVETVGSVASAAGTGALLGSLLPGVGTLIGAGVGGALGGGVAVMRSFQQEQREATSNFTDLTASVRKLRAAQDRASDGLAEASNPQRNASVESDAAAESLNKLLMQQQAATSQQIQRLSVAEGGLTDRNLANAIETLSGVAENGPPGARDDARAQLDALIGVRDAISRGDTEALTTERLLSAFPDTAAEALTRALQRADGGLSDRSAERIGNRMTPSFLAGGLPDDYIANTLRQSGIASGQAQEIAKSVQEQLVRAMTERLGQGLSGGATSGRLNDYRAVNDLQRALRGGFGLERKVEELAKIDDDLDAYMDSLNKLTTAKKEGGDVGKAVENAEKVSQQLLGNAFNYGQLLGISERDFRAKVEKSIETGKAPSVLAGFADGIASSLTEARTAFSEQDAKQIVGLSEDALSEMATGAFDQFQSYVDVINGLNARVSAGNLDADTAIQQALANVVLVTRASADKPGDEGLAQRVLDVQGAFSQMLTGRIDRIRKGMEAGTVSGREGTSEIITLLSRVEALRGRVPEDLRNDALAQIATTITDVVEKQADVRRAELEDAIKTERDPRRKQAKVRQLNLVKRAGDTLSAALESGKSISDPAVRRALAAIGLDEIAIGALEVANAGQMAITARRRVTMHRRTLRALNKADRILLTTLRELGLIAAAIDVSKRIGGRADRIEEYNERLENLDANIAAGDQALAEALAAGSSGADPAPLGQESNVGANDAKQAAEEARDKAMDLISARFEFLKALAGDDPVRVARLDLKEAQELAKFARDRAERFRAKAAIINAKRALRDAILEQAGGSQTFGIPTEIALPNAFEVKAAAARALRAGGGIGVGEGVGARSRSEVSVATTNRNQITIQVATAKDLDRVAEIMSVATGADEKALRSVGFSGGGLI